MNESKHVSEMNDITVSNKSAFTLFNATYLDGFDQVGSAVGYLLGRLDKVPLGNWIGCFRGSQAAGVAQC